MHLCEVTPGFCSFKVKENNYRGHGDSVDQLCWHPSNPDLFVTASGDKTIRIWDVRTTKCIATVNTKGNFRERGALGRKANYSFQKLLTVFFAASATEWVIRMMYTCPSGGDKEE